jgi:hypothetical protein
MELRNSGLTEFELLSSLWWLWCNKKIDNSDIRFYLKDLDLQLEFITLDGYKFISKDKKTIYSYDRKQ